MKNTTELASVCSDHDEVSASLRDVAAYLRGVADATAALSQPAGAPVYAQDLGPSPPKLHVVIKAVEPVSSSRETLFEAIPVSSRHTVPYDGLERAADTLRVRETAGYASLDPVADFFTENGVPDASLDDSWETPFVDERPSDVRLRVGQLSAEWYDLVDARVG
jgi:hypothetical protein